MVAEQSIKQQVTTQHTEQKDRIDNRDNLGDKLWYNLQNKLQDNLIEQTYPEKANHPNQKYRLTEKGRRLLVK